MGENTNLTTMLKFTDKNLILMMKMTISQKNKKR